jgi:D-tyrosyl-tRNA(Tyr) deacylase
MRAVVQRVKQAKVDVDGRTVGQIGPGLLVFLGVGVNDSEKDGEYLANKIAHLRVFSDDQGAMNRSLLEKQGEALVVSQFTLCKAGEGQGTLCAIYKDSEGKRATDRQRRIPGNDGCPLGQ